MTAVATTPRAAEAPEVVTPKWARELEDTAHRMDETLVALQSVTEAMWNGPSKRSGDPKAETERLTELAYAAQTLVEQCRGHYKAWHDIDHGNEPEESKSRQAGESIDVKAVRSLIDSIDCIAVRIEEKHENPSADVVRADMVSIGSLCNSIREMLQARKAVRRGK